MTGPYPPQPPWSSSPPGQGGQPQGPATVGLQHPPTRPPTGAIAWWFGLLALLFIPFVNTLVAGVVMTFVGRSVRGKGELAAVNGAAAANWGLTLVLCTVLFAGGHFALLAAIGSTSSFYPLGIPLTLYGLVYVSHLVATLVGGIRAVNGHRVSWPAIPFFHR